MTSEDKCFKAKLYLLCWLTDSILIEYDKWRQVFESQTVFVMQADQQYTHRVPRGRQVFESQTVFVVQARKKCQAYLETEWISCGDRWSDFGRSYLVARWSDPHVQLAALDRWCWVFFILIVSNLNVLKTDTFSARWVILLVPLSTKLWHGLQEL